MSIRVYQNAPLTLKGRQRLVERCRNRPIAHVAAEMGISRATASKRGKPLQAVRRDRAPGTLANAAAPSDRDRRVGDRED